MRSLVRPSVLLLVLMTSIAQARSRETRSVRPLLLSKHPDDAVHRLYVKGLVVTVLRFEQPCDPERTQILGWEGRFEPVACVGRRVLLKPLRDLASNESVPLLVTLADGTEVPFLLKPHAARLPAWLLLWCSTALAGCGLFGYSMHDWSFRAPSTEARRSQGR